MIRSNSFLFASAAFIFVLWEAQEGRRVMNLNDQEVGLQMQFFEAESVHPDWLNNKNKTNKWTNTCCSFSVQMTQSQLGRRTYFYDNSRADKTENKT